MLHQTSTETGHSQAFMARGALTLSEDDVCRLLTDSSNQTRVDITHKIANAYSKLSLDETEVVVAEQIFRLLMKDTEVKVRSSLSQQLKDSTIIPRDIVLTMARDIELVSLPVLQYSEVLEDTDLIDLVQATNQVTKHIAISKRKSVSASVSNALVEQNDDRIAMSLLHNEGAVLSSNSLERIIAQNAENEAVINAVVGRGSLPVSTVEKLISKVSATIGAELKRKYALPEEQVEQHVTQTRESETLSLLKGQQSEEEIKKLVRQLHANDRLTPSMMLSALCQGDLTFFACSLAQMAELPLSNVRTLMEDRGALGFRAVYNKSGLPETMFPAVRLLLHVVRELETEGEKPGSSRYSNRMVERLLRYAEDEPIENLSYLMALVRKGVS